MASQQAVEALKVLIMSHGRGDHASFENAAESLIRQLAIENKPGEAKFLRDALFTARQNGASSRSLAMMQRPASGLISFVEGKSNEELFFSPETEASLQRIVSEYRAQAKLAEAGLRPKTKLLFWGPPGCGKTASARWLGTQLGIPVGVVRLGALITSYVGETGANVQKIFSSAEQTPMVLLLDEADAVAKSRDDANDVGELRRVVNALLQGLDFFTSKRSIAVLATNHSFLLDSALWRRFDDVVSFPLPKQEQRLAALKHLTSGLRINGNLSALSQKMAGCSFEELTRSVLEVAKTVVMTGKDSIDTTDVLREANAWRQKTKTALLRRGRGSNSR